MTSSYQSLSLFLDMKQGLLVACVFISCTVLAPLMWQMWIILGTANSNFYFGVTLAYNVGQVSNNQLGQI